MHTRLSVWEKRRNALDDCRNEGFALGPSSSVMRRLAIWGGSGWKREEGVEFMHVPTRFRGGADTKQWPASARN